MPLFFFAAAIAMILDQLSKIWIRARLEEGDRIELIPGWIHLQHVHNHGAAWGIFSGQKFFLILFTVVVIGFLLISAREVVKRGTLPSIGFGLILGGALGNLWDRIAYGYVTDFFDLDTSIHAIRTFPVFNIADSALTVGVALMMISLVFQRDEVPTPAPEQAEPQA